MGKHSTERRSHAIPKASIGKRHKARASQGSIPNPSSNQPSRKGVSMDIATTLIQALLVLFVVWLYLS